MKYIYFIFVLCVFVTADAQKQLINFSAADSVTISADLYMPNSSESPFIILFHQAGWSRGEYLNITPMLTNMGYNCLAVDQRSGKEVNDVKNQTFLEAKKMKKSVEYLDAYKDMKAALKKVAQEYARGKLIIWGSSYSASLAFVLATEYNSLVDGIIAFSPGEYFKKAGKSGDFISLHAEKIECPVFITSARDEHDSWKNIYQSLAAKNKTYYLPETKGNHGSRALWQKFNDHQGYRDAVTNFLLKYFPVKVE